MRLAGNTTKHCQGRGWCPATCQHALHTADCKANALLTSQPNTTHATAHVRNSAEGGGQPRVQQR